MTCPPINTSLHVSISHPNTCAGFFPLWKSATQLPFSPALTSQQWIIDQTTRGADRHTTVQPLEGQTGTKAGPRSGFVLVFVQQLCALSLSLIPPCSACDLWVRVNIQDVPSRLHNGPPFTSQGRRARRQEKNVLSDIRVPITPSLHHSPSSV